MSNESAASGRSRERTSTGLLVLVFLLGLVAGPALYMAEVVKDEDRFVALGERVIDEPAVRETVASEITKITFTSLETDEAIANVLPNGTRSLAVPITRFASEAFSDAAFSLIDTEVAVTAREAALREVHRQLLSDDDEEVVLDLRGVIVRTSREVAGPTIGTGVAKLMSDTDSGRYTVAREGSATSTIFSVVRATPDISLAIGLTSLALLAGGILVARDRRRALVRGGLAIAAAAVMSVLAVAIVINTAGVLAQSPIGPEASRGIAQAISSDFAIIQRFPMMVGLSLAAIGMLLGERKAAVALRALPALIWRRDARGAADAVESVVADNPALARLIVWIAGAMVLGSWPDPTSRVIVTVIVITLLAVGSIWLLTSEGRRAGKWRVAVGLPASTGSEVGASDAPRHQMAVVALVALVFIFWPSWDRALVVSFFVIAAVLQAAIEVRPAWRSARRSADRTVVSSTRWSRNAVGWAVAGSVLVVAGGIVLGVRASDSVEASQGCNGHVELCGRPLDQVVFAASHNSMSSTDLGWDLAMQTGDIVEQLDLGVRALLIDTHYWDDSGSVEGGDDAAAAAVIEAALADDEPQPGTWLCHGFCGLGATDFESALSEIKLWMDANPREVVMLGIQDEISTQDTVEAFEASGLLDIVHRHEPSSPWPTLEELIDLDERVLVYAENEGEPSSWYQNAWEETITDTPFKFALKSEFSCDANRGQPENPLFLINHWLTTGVPVREAAESVNSIDELRNRVDQCREARGREPNIIAVDFVEVGDLIAFVDELNGVDVPE